MGRKAGLLTATWHKKYIHYFGNESSKSLFEACGIVTKSNVLVNALNPKSP